MLVGFILMLFMMIGNLITPIEAHSPTSAKCGDGCGAQLAEDINDCEEGKKSAIEGCKADAHNAFTVCLGLCMITDHHPQDLEHLKAPEDKK
tara:strand:+ start:164 stop:439 length:276 start_codon:yes stop_codon:yes gene_type:complete